MTDAERISRLIRINQRIIQVLRECIADIERGAAELETGNYVRMQLARELVAQRDLKS